MLQVLDMTHSYIPEGEEPPRLGAVPVRFFGTYSFSWIESKRAIEPFDDEHMEHAANSRLPEFQRGVTEAKHFQVSVTWLVASTSGDLVLGLVQLYHAPKAQYCRNH